MSDNQDTSVVVDDFLMGNDLDTGSSDDGSSSGNEDGNQDGSSPADKAAIAEADALASSLLESDVVDDDLDADGTDDKTDDKIDDKTDDTDDSSSSDDADEDDDDSSDGDDDSDADSEDEDDFTVVPFAKDLFKEFKLEWKDDYLPKDQDNVAGLKGLIVDIITENSIPVYTNELAEQFDNYLAKGGDAKSFAQAYIFDVDYSKLDAEKDAERIASAYYRETTKWSDERISKTINLSKDAGELSEDAKEMQDWLINNEKTKKANLSQTLEEERERISEERAQQREQAKREIIQTIKTSSKKDLGFELQGEEVEKVIEWITEADPQTGKTGYQTWIDETPHAAIRLALAVFFGGVDEDSLNDKARTKAINDLESNFRKYQKKRKTRTRSKRKPIDKKVDTNKLADDFVLG